MIGKSYEGVDIRVLKICWDGCRDEKPAMWVNGGKIQYLSKAAKNILILLWFVG